MRHEGEEGYALVAAVASIAVFAAMAFTVLSATRMGIADAAGEQAELQAGAAADAGLAMALSRLLSSDLIGQWQIGGKDREFRYGDARILVRIEDERGKVPLNGLDETRATRLLEAAGLGGERLLIARDSLLDWMDDDGFVRPFGAEAAYYRPAGVAPADGFLASVGELRAVRGFDARIIERIAPIVTTYAPPFSFDPRFSTPRALAVMEDGGVAAIDRAREAAGQQTALAFADTPDFTGRAVTILVRATLPDGTGLVRRTVVQLNGRGGAEAPYVILASD